MDLDRSLPNRQRQPITSDELVELRKALIDELYKIQSNYHEALSLIDGEYYSPSDLFYGLEKIINNLQDLCDRQARNE